MNVELTKIHQDALKNFSYCSDQERFNSSEHWMVPTEIVADLQNGKLVGDCDDFAALCAMRCREAGLPARFVLCRCEDGGLHLVCEVDGWILDNRQPVVSRRDDLPYEWISISGYRQGDTWHMIEEK